MLIKMRLGFSDLCEHKFRYGFKDTLNPICFCSIEVEISTHYFLRRYNASRVALRNDLKNILISFSTLSDTILLSLLFYDDDKIDGKKESNNVNVN